jgi:hypothetical protein
MANRMATRSRQPGSFLSDDGEAVRQRLLMAAQTHLRIIEAEFGPDTDDEMPKYVTFILEMWIARLQFLGPNEPTTDD